MSSHKKSSNFGFSSHPNGMGISPIIVYNSLIRQPGWLPSYMSDYADEAKPFWKKNNYGEKVGDYQFIKQALGYE